MRQAGLVLILVSFLIGSLAAVLDKATVNLTYFVPALILGIIGVVIVQLGIRGEAKDESKREANFQVLSESLVRIVEGAQKLDREVNDIDIYDVPELIDARFRDDIAAFVDARESIAHGWGMESYALVMSHFAAAERYMNRVWSTAADGYIDEAHTYVTRFREEFEEAYAVLDGLKGGGSPAVGSASGESTPTAAPT